jgi:hypothetical protein
MSFSGETYYWVTSFIFAFLLFFPTSKLIWSLRIRRAEKKLQRVTTEEERAREKKIARFIAVILTVFFALLFNRSLLS